MSNKMSKYWYLGLLGFVGFYKLPEVWAFFQGAESVWSLANLLWFLWFDYFIPKQNTDDENTQIS